MANDVTNPILSTRDLKKSFLGVTAVNGATFDVPRNLITALIGPNGAGKTTVVSLISGQIKADSGQVSIDGVDVSGWPAHRISQQGLMRTFQLSRELGGMTVLENLMVSARRQSGENLLNVFLRPSAVKKEEQALAERALEILNRYGLYHLRDSRAQALSGGQKKLLEISRAVIADPKILLLDEPMAGVNPALIEKIGEYIIDLRNGGMSILMIEHNLGIVEKICDNVIVLAEGRTLATGKMSELRENEEVVRAYLGEVINADNGR